MKNMLTSLKSSNGEIVIYKTKDGLTKIDVKIESDTVWLSQQQMAELYNTTKRNISLHIKIYLTKMN